MKRTKKSLAKTIFAIILLSIILLGTEEQERAQSNDIIDIRVLSGISNVIVLEVNYFYLGNFGENVFLGAKMANYGEVAEYYTCKPGKVFQGRHRTKIVLSIKSTSPGNFTTNQILLFMYIGRSYTFLIEFFPYYKTWSNIQASQKLKPKHDIPNISPMRDVPNLKVTSAGFSRSYILPRGIFSFRYNLEATGQLDQALKMGIFMGIFIKKGPNGHWLKKWSLPDELLYKLSKGEIVYETFEFQIPDWGLGEYYTSIHADVHNEIRESNEEDNSVERALRVRSKN